MLNRKIPCVLMRAGTSRGPFFLREWLPEGDEARDQALIGAIGASDPLQLDGLGGGSTLPGQAYAGAAPAIADTARGNAQLMFPSLFTAQPYLRSGKLRALAVAGPARLGSLPELPTLAEAGVAGVELTQWYALFAPAKTPAPVVAQLNQALNTVLQDPEIIARFDADGARVQTSTPEELHRLLLAERTKWRQAVQQTGLRMEPQIAD